MAPRCAAVLGENVHGIEAWTIINSSLLILVLRYNLCLCKYICICMYIYIYIYIYQNRILTIEAAVLFGMSRSAVRLCWEGLSGPERSLKSTFEHDYFIASRGLRA